MEELFVPIISDVTYMTSCWYREIFAGVKNGARRKHIKIKSYSDDELPDNLNTLPEVVIITGAAFPSIEMLKNAGKKIIVAGANASEFGNDISSVTTDRVEETRMLIRYFKQCHKNRIALVGFRKDSFHDMERFYAALNSTITLQSSITGSDVFFTDSNLEECFQQFYASVNEYDGVICPNDATALCMTNFFINIGIRIPQDLYVASFANMKIGEYATPSLTSVAIDYENVGMQAYNIWEFINTQLPQDMVCTMNVPSKLMIRKSTAYTLYDIESDTSAFNNILKQSAVYDKFYADPLIKTMMNIENCLAYRDEIDCQLIIDLFNGMVYEDLAEKYYFSVSTIRYRLNNIYQDAGVNTRNEFLNLIRSSLGSNNPFKL